MTDDRFIVITDSIENRYVESSTIIPWSRMLGNSELVRLSRVLAFVY